MSRFSQRRGCSHISELAWHHRIAVTLIAVWFLISETHRGQQLTPALTLPQVRYGLSVLLLKAFLTLDVPRSVATCSANECATSRPVFTIIVPVTACPKEVTSRHTVGLTPAPRTSGLENDSASLR